MKLIVAIIKPFKLDDVKDAVKDLGVQGLTISEVQGFGRQRGPHRGVPRRGVHGRLRPEGPTSRSSSTTAMPTASSNVSSTAARTGQIGDGKVWLVPVENAWRIRTGEVGPDACVVPRIVRATWRSPRHREVLVGDHTLGGVAFGRALATLVDIELIAAAEALTETVSWALVALG